MTQLMRKVLLNAWILQLQETVSTFDWSMFDLADSQATPRSIQEKKGVCLRGELRDTSALLAASRQAASFCGMSVRGVTCTFIYYDWSIGTLELELDLMATILVVLAPGTELGNRMYAHVAANTSAIIDLTQIDAELALVVKRLIGSDEKQSSSAKPGAKLLSNYCVGIIAAAQGTLGSPAPAELRHIASLITGSTSTDRDDVICESVCWSAAGFGAQFVVQDTGHPSYAYDRDRIRWMWRLVSMYWSSFWETSHQVSQLTVRLIANDRRLMESARTLTTRIALLLGANETASRNLVDIDRKILATEAFAHELSPRMLCGYPLDERVYRGVWLAWNGDELLQDVRSQLAMHREFFSGQVAARTSRSQERINLILFVLNVLMFSTVITALIDVYDVGNSIIEPNWRLVVVFCATAFFFVASLSFLLRRR